MSNPAIVLMTDPSRCSLGDVHYLLQALREMQQMGDHAVPQAFCDHPAAAKGFIEAYAHAYPQLVLQDGGIPTPDHLQSLIANGQIGALGQPPELTSFGGQVPFGSPRPAEQNGPSGFPIVVLTLGSSQVLIDAMQQSPAMKDSIRLIDIAPDGTDNLPVSIAEAVANGGLDGDGGWDAEGMDMARSELDEVAGASIRASGDMALERDPLDLEGMESADASGSEEQGYHEDAGQEPATFEPATPAEPTAAASAEPAVEPAAAVEAPAADEAYGASAAAEPASEQASTVETVWADDAPVEVDEPTAESEELQAEDAADDAPPKDAAGEDAGGQPDYAAGEDDLDDDDDVYYPPVGDLIVGADVLYPALDQAAAQGVLQELVSVLLDDAIFDPDQAFEGLPPPPPDDGALVRQRVDEQATIRSSEHVVTIEDLYGTFDQENEDVFADSGAARPSHDTDL